METFLYREKATEKQGSCCIILKQQLNCNMKKSCCSHWERRHSYNTFVNLRYVVHMTQQPKKLVKGHVEDLNSSKVKSDNEIGLF